MPGSGHLKGGVDGYLNHWRELRDADVAARAAASRFAPKTRDQEAYWRAMGDRPLVACDGPSGAGKTVLACQRGADLFESGRVNSLVFTRPQVSAGQPSGFIPGGAAQKMLPFMYVIAGYLRRMLPGQRMTVVTDPEADVDLSARGVYFLPVEYARGVTLDDCFVFADECQNFTGTLLRLLTGRQGRNCTLVMSGHERQCDLPGGPAGWLHWLGLLAAHPDPDWAVVRLTHADVLRSGVVAKTERLWDGEWAPPPVESGEGPAAPPRDPPPGHADALRGKPVPRRRRPS